MRHSSCESHAPKPVLSTYVEPDVPNTVPLAHGVERIYPKDVHRMLRAKECVLVDLRGKDRSAGSIPGSFHCPAVDGTILFQSKIPGLKERFRDKNLVVFTCMYSAHRGPQCANWYKEQADPKQRVAIMSGGFRGWEGNGLPVENASSGDKDAADAYALQQGLQFTQEQPQQQQQMLLGGYVRPPAYAAVGAQAELAAVEEAAAKAAREAAAKEAAARCAAHRAAEEKASIAGLMITLRSERPPQESRNETKAPQTSDVDAICKLLSAMSLQPERTVAAAPPAAAAAVPPAAHPPAAVPVPAAPPAAAAAAKQQSMNPAIHQ